MKSQDELEPAGRYRVEVDASFPTFQKLAKRSTLTIRVRNIDTKPIPNVAVTVKNFDQRRDDPTLADPSRPIFAVNKTPRGGETALVGTYALGRLMPGDTKTFQWSVTAVVPGPFDIDYRVSAGLSGKPKAVLDDGTFPVQGEFVGTIVGPSPRAGVDPGDGETITTEDGRVIPPGQVRGKSEQNDPAGEPGFP